MIKKILISYTFFCALGSSYAQNSDGVNALIIKSVEHSLYVVRVDYMLRLKSDPSRECGRNQPSTAIGARPAVLNAAVNSSHLHSS